MLIRIYFDDRWIPVNLPDNTYPEAFLDTLAARLTHHLGQFLFPEPIDWSSLQMVELEGSSREWQATLYLSSRTVDAGSFYW